MPIGQKYNGQANGPSLPPRTFSSGVLGFRLSEYAYTSQAVAADASGTATLQFGPVPGDSVWLVERIAISSASVATTTVGVYVGSVDRQNLVDASYAGNRDIADETSPILVRSNDKLVIQWTGATAGAECAARIQYQSGSLGAV